jgi:glycosyltransferase involved in cell wall biosynthesis
LRKRVAVVTSAPLFAEGGHLVIARALVEALRDAGHEASMVLTPQNRFGRQGAAYLATWLTDVGMGDGKAIDHVISLRYPSYAVRHPNHVVWLNHTMREYYDQWDTFRETLSWKGRIKEGMRRRVMHAADRYLLTRNVRKVYAQSRTIAARLQRWGGIPSEVLYPPPPQRPYRCDGYGDYVFAVSRLAPLKRLSLLIDALSTPEGAGIRCVIAGEGDEQEALAQAIVTGGLSSRIRRATGPRRLWETL